MTQPPDRSARASDLAARRPGPAAAGRGSGASRFGDHALCGDEGLAILIRDLTSGDYWVAGGGSERTGGAATYRDERAGIRATLDVSGAADAASTLFQLALVNLGAETRHVDVTTFAEVVLLDPRAHAAHPAFAKLFLQTEFVDGAAAILVRRRPREPGERHPWLVHASLDGGPVEFETDRARFLGRGRHPGRPAAMVTRAPLSGTCGNVLDPCLALRRTVTLAPGEPVTLGFLLGAAADLAGALAMARRGKGRAVAVEPPAESGPAVTPEAPNGFGRFDPDGREYVIQVRRRADGSLVVPPRPWVNVIAGESFGCLVSETGAGTTWGGNSREQRLTPWFNDPVLDPHGDAVYLRDEDQGAFWSCWPGPSPAPADYEVRHGFGYSGCRVAHGGIETDTLVFVARRDPVRVTRVRVRNAGAATRRLSLWGHARLVLGTTVEDSAPAVTASYDPESGALLARNGKAGPWTGHAAFGALVSAEPGLTIAHDTSRAAFLGPALDLATPAFAVPSGDPTATTGLDAAFTHRAAFTLAPGETREVAILLGQASSAGGARELVARFAQPGAGEAACAESRDFWRDGLAGLRVETPAPAIDLMVNGWLGYQTLSCRLRGRTALYQSGGAFGFRDQLQDALALLPLWPDLARAQILLHAAHQFVEGDVLHWWHPPLDRGIRTRFADDLLWLPYLAAQYVAATGDAAVLAEIAPYLAARSLAPGEDEAFLAPEPAGESGDIYDHCCRSLDRSLAVGAHGLPLFGTGDWNDGMNRVGRKGRGESVWMGFFLVATIDAFAPLVEARGDLERLDRYRRHRQALAAALNDVGWDGGWYRRGYYDDGAPLGTATDPECRIDALVQAWSVLSGVAPRERAAQALDAVETHLVDREAGLIRLLTPPFVDTPRDPGYIKGYVAGVRENGGQYTHAALWVVRAMAEAGRRDRAAALLEMLSPVSHADTPARVARYQIEPYVVAADVYGASPHVGRGGWSWYTGSSGWMLRVALESVLGLRLEGGQTLVVKPCIPDGWERYGVRWRLPGSESVYDIQVVNPDGCAAVVVAANLDGKALAVADGVCRIPLRRDSEVHRVKIVLGAAPEGPP
ncbi:MAG TPA: glycosyl transferase [Candidatus Krumholzibacteria bacterium]|nr:glycosyl transferase [Candidatus Krumholzibacteria bacterium]HPD70568.1 glycosyl transferase [Candidatus Krumholzibacteria bacterium]HRY39732.1 glycosyl transferase [Candidatus Krumholzibacteria bacterium]